MIWNLQGSSQEDTCEDIEGEGSRGACYAKLALKTGDETFCEKITTEVTTDTFKNYCYFNVAETNQDVEMCEKAGDMEDSCFCAFVLLHWIRSKDRQWPFATWQYLIIDTTKN